MNIEETILNVAKHFGINGSFVGYSTFSSGHINSTYKANFTENGILNSYVIQGVNTYVFKKPELIMDNIAMISEHFRSHGSDGFSMLNFHKCDQNSYCFFDEDGKCWRLYDYCDGVTFDNGENPEILLGGGRAFGKFQKNLSSFDASRLNDTIPDFHNTRERLNTFYRDIKSDEMGRVCEVSEEIEYIKSIDKKVSVLSQMSTRGELPIRATHNDTKINNVLFDRNTHEPITVVDLDTVMPGLAMYDFGDAVRTAANSADEDERDLSKVYLNLERFEILVNGFIPEVSSALSSQEIELMALGAFTMTAECGIRFLNDYINGDKYFRIACPDHNLARARCQLKLAMDIDSKYDSMCEIVRKAAYKS